MTCAVMSRRHVFLITPKLYSLKSLDHGLKRFNRPILPLDMAASFCLGSPTTLTSKICRKCLNMSISFGYDKFLARAGGPFFQLRNSLDIHCEGLLVICIAESLLEAGGQLLSCHRTPCLQRLQNLLSCGGSSNKSAFSPARWK